MRSTKYTREVLAPIVASSTSISDVIRRLGKRPTGGMHRFIRARIRQAGLDTSHFGGARTGPIARLSATSIAALAARCTSVAQMLATLDLPLKGRPHLELSRRIRELHIDTRHFSGSGWARGHTSASHPAIARTTRKNALPDARVFVANGPVMPGPRLLRRLLAIGWEYRCAWCGLAEWRGQRLVLHVDHINGINNDHRHENLRLLCPNCHSQTETYCNARR